MKGFDSTIIIMINGDGAQICIFVAAPGSLKSGHSIIIIWRSGNRTLGTNYYYGCKYSALSKQSNAM